MTIREIEDVLLSASGFRNEIPFYLKRAALLHSRESLSREKTCCIKSVQGLFNLMGISKSEENSGR